MVLGGGVTRAEFFEPRASSTSRAAPMGDLFLGGKLNIAWNCVHRWRSDRPAAVFRGEDGARRSLTYSELSDAVTRLAERLVELGVEPGDRVAIYLPMSPEAAIASHACAHVGAVQVPVFSGSRRRRRRAARRLRRPRVAITARARRCAGDARCRCSRSPRRHDRRRRGSST
jgi:acetyl-CoA synthetase